MSMQTEIRTVDAGHLPMSSAHRAKEVTTVEARIGSYFVWLMSRPTSKKCVSRRWLAIETRLTVARNTRDGAERRPA
jgi:hypothetical protein